jgi:hypothetical protein
MVSARELRPIWLSSRRRRKDTTLRSSNDPCSWAAAHHGQRAALLIRSHTLTHHRLVGQATWGMHRRREHVQHCDPELMLVREGCGRRHVNAAAHVDALSHADAMELLLPSSRRQVAGQGVRRRLPRRAPAVIQKHGDQLERGKEERDERRVWRRRKRGRGRESKADIKIPTAGTALAAIASRTDSSRAMQENTRSSSSMHFCGGMGGRVCQSVRERETA